MTTGRARLRTIVVAIVVAGVAVVALWLSDAAPVWLASAISTVVIAALVEEVLRRQRRLDRGNPIEYHVTISDASYVFMRAVPGESERTVPASGHTVRLHVTAPDQTVILAGLRPVVLERRHPRGELSPQAGALEIRTYTVLLDEEPPRLQPLGAGSPPSFSYKVGPNDPETFELRAETERWLVTWLLELDWVCNRRSGTIRVDLAGHPFRTVARPPFGLNWDYQE